MKKKRYSPGDIVQVAFAVDREYDTWRVVTETLWLAITARFGKEYVGVILTDPVFTTKLAKGDEVRFNRKDVCR